MNKIVPSSHLTPEMRDSILKDRKKIEKFPELFGIGSNLQRILNFELISEDDRENIIQMLNNVEKTEIDT